MHPWDFNIVYKYIYICEYVYIYIYLHLSETMSLCHSGREQLQTQSCKWRPLRSHFYCCWCCSWLWVPLDDVARLHTYGVPQVLHNNTNKITKKKKTCFNTLLWICMLYEVAEWRWSMQRIWIKCKIVTYFRLKTQIDVLLPQHSYLKGVILENCRNIVVSFRFQWIYV